MAWLASLNAHSRSMPTRGIAFRYIVAHSPHSDDFSSSVIRASFSRAIASASASGSNAEYAEPANMSRKTSGVFFIVCVYAWLMVSDWFMIDR